MGEEHPRATKWKQDMNVAFAKWHCAEPTVIKPPFHQWEFKNDKKSEAVNRTSFIPYTEHCRLTVSISKVPVLAVKPR